MLKKLASGKAAPPADKKEEVEDEEDSGPEAEEKNEPHIFTIQTAWGQTFKVDTNNLNIKAFDALVRTSLMALPWPGGSSLPALSNAKRYVIKLTVGGTVQYTSDTALRNELDMWSYDYATKMPVGCTAMVEVSATNGEGRARRVVA